MTRTSRAVFAVISMVVCLSCRSATESGGVEVSFLAAASTTEAITEIRDLFEERTGHRVELTFSGSSRLAVQIRHGARADLFLPASAAWADEVALAFAAHHPRPQRVELISNRMVLVARNESTLDFDDFESLAESSSEVAIADPKSVPAGVYSAEALDNLGVLHRLEPRLVPATNVRTALRYVESGAVDAGLVYASDVVVSSKVRVVAEVDSNLHRPISYPLLLLPQQRERVGARELFEFLQSEEARSVFERFGFAALPEELSWRS